MFIDIHTHHTASQAGTIVNLLRDFDSIPAQGFYSAGLHPWYLEKDNEALHVNELKTALHKPNVVAVGECGLDKLCDTDYHLQEYYFSRQIELANEYGKPMIIHCVRSFDEVLHLLKKKNITVPVIFHGFNKSHELALRIIKQGYYLSFGKHLQQSSVATVFASIPLNHLFLETDASDLHIEELYLTASALKGININELQENISVNASVVFGSTFG
ncbi:MAG: TatD family hydrolase [Bacteroidetes bacterium]|nr:TatD family hydrolase [Bacteroidota bacterium]